MAIINDAIAESIGLKLWDLEHRSNQKISLEENSALWNEIRGIQWVARLLGINDVVSKMRQEQTVLCNKTYEMGKDSALKELESSKGESGNAVNMVRYRIEAVYSVKTVYNEGEVDCVMVDMMVDHNGNHQRIQKQFCSMEEWKKVNNQDFYLG